MKLYFWNVKCLNVVSIIAPALGLPVSKCTIALQLTLALSQTIVERNLSFSIKYYLSLSHCIKDNKSAINVMKTKTSGGREVVLLN